MKISFAAKLDISTCTVELLESNGFCEFEHHNGKYLTSYNDNNCTDLTDSEFLLNMKGLFIKVFDGNIKVYTDIYRSVPLYYFSLNEVVYIFTDFSIISKYTKFPKVLDEVGFWEYLLFGNGIYNRTLFESVKQMPAAGCLVIDSITSSVTLDYYWDFNFYQNNTTKNEKVVIEQYKNKLITIFNREIKNKKELTLGLSGGMDSRLAFSLLDESNLLANTSYFTYGYDERILEASIAKNILDIKGLSNWKFHKLDSASYKLGFENFFKLSGGSIGPQHVHMYDYLSKNNIKNLISTYYSDAVFGYSAMDSVKNDSWQDVDYFQEIEKFGNYIDEDIKNHILLDIKSSLKGYDPKSNYSSINEYKYVVERTPKFHMNLLFLQSQLVEQVFSPFANYELLKATMELPIDYRFDKSLIRNVIANIDERLISTVGDTSNQRVYFKKDVKTIINNIFSNKQALMLLITKSLNIALFKMFSGRLHIFDQYATEIHSNILQEHFKCDIEESTSYFERIKILNPEMKKIIDVVPPFGGSTSLRFQIVDIYNVISKMEDHD